MTIPWKQIDRGCPEWGSSPEAEAPCLQTNSVKCL